MNDLATFTAAGNDFGFRLLDELLGRRQARCSSSA